MLAFCFGTKQTERLATKSSIIIPKNYLRVALIEGCVRDQGDLATKLPPYIQESKVVDKLRTPSADTRLQWQDESKRRLEYLTNQESVVTNTKQYENPHLAGG